MQVLVVGHGLAGALAAWHLHRSGCTVTVAEAGFPHTASRAAGALISPITGQRFRLMPAFETLIGDALADYRQIEAALGTTLVRPMTVRRRIGDDGSRDAIARRLGDDAYRDYLTPVDASTVDIRGAWRLDVDALLDGLRRYWQAHAQWCDAVVDWSTVHPGWSWQDTAYDVLVSAQGYGCHANPWFADAPLAYNHGEALDVEVTGAQPDTPIVPHDGHWALPMGGGRYRVGATFHPGLTDPRPLPETPAALVDAARRLLGNEIRIIRRVSGSRPVGPGRQPWLGEAAHPGLYAVNGLGSKGSLYAPLLARRLRVRLGLPACA